jgi:hypothetical protein
MFSSLFLLVGFSIIYNSVFVFQALHFGAFMKERVRCFFIYSFGHLALWQVEVSQSSHQYLVE